MAKIKWTSKDVIKAVQEAVTPALSKNGQRPGGLQNLMDKIKNKIPGMQGEQQV